MHRLAYREHIERFEVRLRLLTAPTEEVGEQPRAEAAGGGYPGLILAVDEIEELPLDVFGESRSERRRRMPIPPPRQPAQIVGQ
jgi:hypothetical protein